MVPHPLLIDLVLILTGCSGFILAAYIYRCKRRKKPLICPLRASCDLVTTSDYSKFCGIPVEVLGLSYYAFIVILHLLAVAEPAIFSITVARFSLALSSIAFLFSLYLTAVQAFILKQWCTWCLCSASLCAAIFILTVIAAPVGIF